MLPNNAPLRYTIHSWHDLPHCLSNTSKDLKLVTATLMHDDISGIKISVRHKHIGELFSYVVDPEGPIVEDSTRLTTAQILQQLRTFGFYVEFTPAYNLSGEMLKYLITLNELRMDKLRMLTVKDGQDSYEIVVAFKEAANPAWINNQYSPGISEYTKALATGTAIAISANDTSKDFNWSWLANSVVNIADILANNS